jgi:hypothetical protein
MAHFQVLSPGSIPSLLFIIGADNILEIDERKDQWVISDGGAEDIRWILSYKIS